MTDLTNFATIMLTITAACMAMLLTIAVLSAIGACRAFRDRTKDKP